MFGIKVPQVYPRLPFKIYKDCEIDGHGFTHKLEDKNIKGDTHKGEQQRGFSYNHLSPSWPE